MIKDLVTLGVSSVVTVPLRGFGRCPSLRHRESSLFLKHLDTATQDDYPKEKTKNPLPS